MKTGYLARIFRALSFSSALAAMAFGAAMPDFKDFRANPTPAATAQLMAYAGQHAKEQSGAFANLSLGMASYKQKNFLGAIQFLALAKPMLPKVADYVAFYLASAKMETGDYAGAAKELAEVRASASPLGGKAALLEATTLMHGQNYLDAIKVLRERFDALPHPEGDELLAHAYEGQGERVQAAVLYQRVYYMQPVTPQAVDAAASIERLKKVMGKEYPPSMPAQVLVRGDQWMAVKQYAKAKLEFQEMTKFLSSGSLEHEQAMVGVGAADVAGGNVALGYRYLKALRLAKSDADAERYFYLEEGARTTSDEVGLHEALQKLEKSYPESPWRLKALVAAGNGYLNERKPESAVPLFRAAADKFPSDAVTALGHWRVAWNSYLRRGKDVTDLMKEQITKYADDQRAVSALYFLGRLSEESQDFSSARTYYERLQSVFPHYYYGTLGTDRLTDPNIVSAVLNTELGQSLDRIAFPARPDIKYNEPSASTEAYIERVKLLVAAGFPDWAEMEIRFDAGADGQRPVLALELAKAAPTLAIGLRHMKVFTPEYLTLNFDRVPKEVWGYLFPMPLREDLIRISKAKNLDPYLVAGLIRQESEFNPVVVSRAHAFGWMQLLPSTGAMVAKQEGLAPFQPSMLLDPLVSLKLGTAYLRTQLDLWNNSLEQTLAAYNAGPGRVHQWTTGVQFREPAEFVESIPFTETREYVQSVIRNAAVYRQLYGSKTPPPQPANALTSSHVAPHAAGPVVAARATTRVTTRVPNRAPVRITAAVAKRPGTTGKRLAPRKRAS